MDEHLTLYVDFLGTRAAISEWDKQKLDSLTRLLHGVANLRSDFASLSESPTGSGTQVKIQPVVTTFSDHLVISYPLEILAKTFLGDACIRLTNVQGLTASIAALAMKLGLLIRGGLAVGPLHHEQGVVLGPALVEAYCLESRVAIYPRIAVSRKIYTEARKSAYAPQVLLTDQDGIAHLNYFSRLITVGPKFGEQFDDWLNRIQNTIKGNVERFEREEKWNQLSKWAWFRNQIENAKANLPPALFEPHSPPSAGAQKPD